MIKTAIDLLLTPAGLFVLGLMIAMVLTALFGPKYEDDAR